MSDRPQVLVVDDETQMVSIISFALETQGFNCVKARSSEQAWKLFQVHSFDLLVLDVMLPGASGVQLATRIRAISDVPIIFLTARGDEEDRLAGLMAGADDYVTKPFSPRELALRAQAIVRRFKPQNSASRVVNGSLIIDISRRVVMQKNFNLKLSDVESRLLAVLARNAGQPVTWSELLNDVWGTLDTHGGRDMIKTTVHRLRNKLGEQGDDLVVSVRGIGYLMPVLEDNA